MVSSRSLAIANTWRHYCHCHVPQSKLGDTTKIRTADCRITSIASSKVSNISLRCCVGNKQHFLCKPFGWLDCPKPMTLTQDSVVGIQRAEPWELDRHLDYFRHRDRAALVIDITRICHQSNFPIWLKGPTYKIIWLFKIISTSEQNRIAPMVTWNGKRRASAYH